MRKVIFFDIDGTLVDFQGQMSESTKQALLQVQQNGSQIVLCSGRSKPQIYPWLLDLHFNGIIAATGAYVECGGKVIYRNFMSEESLRMAVALLEEADACYSAQTEEGILITEKNWKRQRDKMQMFGGSEDLFEVVFGNAQIVEEIDQRKNIQKLNFDDSQLSVSEIRERLSLFCDITESSFKEIKEDSGEITCRSINKAWGMQNYITYAGISSEDTIAFGDGPNDFDMLEFAAVGVAMGNAREELKQIADYVTTEVDQEGIANALCKLGLIE